MADYCWSTRLGGFTIRLSQENPDCFTVQYGRQTESGLTYHRAAMKLGNAMMHALAVEGRLDNRTMDEAAAELRAGSPQVE